MCRSLRCSSRSSRSGKGRGAVAGRVVRVVAGDGEVDGEEGGRAVALVDEAEEGLDGGALVDAEARGVAAGDGARVGEGGEAALPDHLLHAEVREAARVEQAAAVAGAGQRARDRPAGQAARRVVRRLGVGRRGAGAEHGEETLDALGVGRVRALPDQGVAGQRAQVRGGVAGPAVERESARAGRLEDHPDHVAPRRRAAERAQVVARDRVAGRAGGRQAREAVLVRERASPPPRRAGQREQGVPVQPPRGHAGLGRGAERRDQGQRGDRDRRRARGQPAHPPEPWQQRPEREQGGRRREVCERDEAAERVAERACRRVQEAQGQRGRHHGGHTWDVNRCPPQSCPRRGRPRRNRRRRARAGATG